VSKKTASGINLRLFKISRDTVAIISFSLSSSLPYGKNFYNLATNIPDIIYIGNYYAKYIIGHFGYII
jgi:hypothetical protein